MNKKNSVLKTINLITNSLPKVVGYSGDDEVIPYGSEEDCFGIGLFIQIDKKEESVYPIYSLFEPVDDLDSNIQNISCIHGSISSPSQNILVDCDNEGGFRFLNKKQIQECFSNTFGNIEEYLSSDLYQKKKKFNKTLLDKIDFIYSVLPHEMDRTPKGKFIIRAEYGDQGYVDNSELNLKVLLDPVSNQIIPFYYSEDDRYFYMIDGFWDIKKVDKQELIASFSNSFGWIENFEFEGEFINR